MNFQEKLQSLRKENGLSQEDLAEKVGVSRQAVAKWELGQSYPDIDNLVALSDLFRISVDRLLKHGDECNLRLISEENIRKDELADFLCEAKTAGYAAGKAEEAKSCRPSSRDITYASGDYTYIDSYFGVEEFTGEEAVFLRGQAVYSMNYCGRVIGEGFSGEFLKEALALVPKEYPFRGPVVYHSGDYSYHCTFSGELEWFQGYEEIYLHSTKIYECYFHGGCVK